MPSAFTNAATDFLVDEGFSQAIAQAIVNIAEYAAIEFAVNSVQKALLPRPKSGVGAGLEANYYNPEASIRIVIGEVRIGGMLTIPERRIEP